MPSDRAYFFLRRLCSFLLGAAALFGQAQQSPLDTVQLLDTRVVRGGGVRIKINSPGGTFDNRALTLERGGDTVEIPGEKFESDILTGLIPFTVPLGDYLVNVNVGGTRFVAPTKLSVLPPGFAPVSLTPFAPDSVTSSVIKNPTLRRVLQIRLRGSGFLVRTPSDNAIWIDGIRTPVQWDGCRAERPPSELRGEVVSPEEMILCGVPAPARGQMAIAAGYGDSQGNAQALQVPIPWRTQAALVATAFAVGIGLFVSFLTRTSKSHDWTLLLRDGAGVYSLPRFQLLLWIFVALYAFAYVFCCRVALGIPGFPDVPSAVLTLLGIATALVVADSVLSLTATREPLPKPSLGVINDLIAAGGSVAADRLVLLLWTVLGADLYWISLVRTRADTLVDLPSPPSWMLIVTGLTSTFCAAMTALRARQFRPEEPAASAKPELRDYALARAERRRLEDEKFQRNLPDTFIVRSLSWSQVRFFQDGAYEFAPRVNVLLGRNGYGKSLLFRTLAAMIQCELDSSGALFPADAPHSSSGPGPGDPVVKLHIERNGKAETTVRDAIDFVDFKDATGRIPLLAIPDSRFVNRSTLAIKPSDGRGKLNRNGAHNFIAQEPFDNVILDLLANLGLDYLEGGRRFNQPIFRLIESVVRELTEDEKFAFHSIEREDAAFQIFVRTAGNEDRPLAIQQASQGTLSVLAVFGLIYSFLQSVWPNLKKDAVLAAPGIVLIDELDAHLHPRWQQKIMGLLTGTFPNVQFIVSAHSPLIVAGCDQKEVAVLRRDVKTDRFVFQPILRDFLGVTSEELYRTIFDIEDVDRLYKEYSVRSAAGDAERVQREIDRLEAKPGRTAEEEAALDRLWQDDRLMQKADSVRKKRLDAIAAEASVERLQDEVDRLKRLLEQERRPV